MRGDARLPARRAATSSTTGTTCAARPRRPASRTRSPTRASSRPTSGRSSAAATGRSAGRCCPAIPADIAAIDDELRGLFPDDAILQRWLALAPERVAFQGLPARICWLGYGDRARAGLAINELVRSGRVRAPVVIGRDHLDSGSVASPYRETESMRDGSDAIADWPILNALLNTAAGATWVSVHHGGGVGIGNSIHAGMVVVADGTDDAAERLERVLTTDPGTGILRHADAGYEDALDAAREHGLDLPGPADGLTRRPVDRSSRFCHGPATTCADLHDRIAVGGGLGCPEPGRAKRPSI